MSEIKITKDSLENAILKDGQFVSGYVAGTGYISANGDGAHAEGYVDNAGTINALGDGAYAGGYINNSSIFSRGKGSFVYGSATSGIIDASGMGAVAIGRATSGSINTNGHGAVAIGRAESGSINANGNGAVALGYNTQAIGNGTFACGKGTIANQEAMSAIGKYNVSTNTNTLFVVGDGSRNANRSDAFRVNSLGSVAGANSVPSSVQAKVNGVPDVYLGCPIGTIVMWAGETAPDGWFLCDGTPIPVYGQPGNYKTLECEIQGKNFSDDELHYFAFDVIKENYGQIWYKKSSEHDWIASGSFNILTTPNEFTVTGWTDDINEAFKFFIEDVVIKYMDEDINDISTYSGKLIPNFQYKFPIGTEIGGVGNVIYKGKLTLSYSGNKRTYSIEEGEDLEIGQFLDLSDASGLDHTLSYTNYCVIVGIEETGRSIYKISVNGCDKFGKITNKTIKNLFDYFDYNQHSLSSTSVTNIKINENEYSTILGSTGGEETHTLSMLEIAPNGSLMVNATQPKEAGVVGWQEHQKAAQAHNNIPPFLAINFIIKYK